MSVRQYENLTLSFLFWRYWPSLVINISWTIWKFERLQGFHCIWDGFRNEDKLSLPIYSKEEKELHNIAKVKKTGMIIGHFFHLRKKMIAACWEWTVNIGTWLHTSGIAEHSLSGEFNLGGPGECLHPPENFVIEALRNCTKFMATIMIQKACIFHNLTLLVFTWNLDSDFCFLFRKSCYKYMH